MKLIKLIESGKDKNYFGYTFRISNPDEYYESGENATRYCFLNIRIGSRYWYWKIPEIFKPKKEWVDTSQYSWNTSKKGGYWNYIPKQYGVSILDEYIHTYYGIQPGCWSSKDKSNSDHTKLFGIPWKQLDCTYYKYWTPSWELFNTINPNKNGVLDFNSIRSSQENVPKIKFKFNDFDGEERIATCYIIERRYDYGTGWFKWLKYFKKPLILYSLDINFDKEVGYEKGSWKGGVMGHSIEIKFKESPLEAFKRYGSSEDRYKNHGTKCRDFSNIEILK